MLEKELQVITAKILEILKNQNRIIDYFHIPNGSYFNSKTGYRHWKSLQLMGAKSGASDLVVILNHKVLFLELKKRGGKLSDKQRDFLDQVSKSLVCDGHVVNSVEKLEEILTKENV